MAKTVGIKSGGVTTVIPMLVNYKDASWRMVIGMALGYFVLPLLIILSKALNREIEFLKYKIV